jgi:very-short-patch-repair endonuclease/gamma-glutamylcyclotransferase (GGCT)/AIG2-like uncharacterized protein YtfP
MASDRDPSWRLRGFARIMRHEATEAEHRLCSQLRDRQLAGFKFRRQVPIEGYIVDFYCMERKLAVELDGGQHFDPEQAAYDQVREEALRAHQIRVLRFQSDLSLKDTDAVLTEILRALEEEPSPLPSPGVPGEGVALGENLLFIYGTLLPGVELAEMSAVCGQLKTLGPAVVRGKLYDLGPYPGVILDSAGTTQGQIVHVPTNEVWKTLDEYEACPLPDSPDGLFRRVRTSAMLANGEPIDCWIYVYNRPLNGSAIVEGGCWLTHQRGHKIKST